MGTKEWLCLFVLVIVDAQKRGLNYSCDFENENETFCGWTQGNDDDFDWTRWSGRTFSNDTGPSTDHTKGDSQGHYIYIETTDRHIKDKAILVSMVFPASFAKNRCIEFFYHGFGATLGSLSVHVKSKVKKTIFHITSFSDDSWARGFAQLDNETHAFNILFEATVGGAFGDIALDDINIYECTTETTMSPRKRTSESTMALEIPTRSQTTSIEAESTQAGTSQTWTASTQTTTAATASTSTPTAATTFIAPSVTLSTLITTMGAVSTSGLFTYEATQEMPMANTEAGHGFPTVLNYSASSGIKMGQVTPIDDFWETSPPTEPAYIDQTLTNHSTYKDYNDDSSTTNKDNDNNDNADSDMSQISDSDDKTISQPESVGKPDRKVAYIVGLVGSVVAVVIAVTILILGLRMWSRKRQSMTPAAKISCGDELNEIVLEEPSPEVTTSPETNQSKNGSGETVLGIEATKESNNDFLKGKKESQPYDRQEDSNVEKTLSTNTNAESTSSTNEPGTCDAMTDSAGNGIESTSSGANMGAPSTAEVKVDNEKECGKEIKSQETSDLTATADGNREDKKDEKKDEEAHNKEKENFEEQSQSGILKTNSGQTFSLLKKLFHKKNTQFSPAKNTGLEAAHVSEQFEKEEVKSENITICESVPNVEDKHNNPQEDVRPNVDEAETKEQNIGGQKPEEQNVELPKVEDNSKVGSVEIDKKANDKMLKKLKKERENEEKRKKKEEKKKKKEETKSKKAKVKQESEKVKSDKEGVKSEDADDKKFDLKGAERGDNTFTAQGDSGQGTQNTEIQKDEKTDKDGSPQITVEKYDQMIGITTNLFDLINDVKGEPMRENENQAMNMTQGHGAINETSSDLDITLTNNNAVDVRL